MDSITVSVILNSLLFGGLFVVSVSLWNYKKGNGIARAMSIFNFAAMLHGPGMLIVIGLRDLYHFNFEEQQAWNLFSGLWILSGIYLVYLLLRDKDE